MNLVGKKVIHKIKGAGVVISQSEKIVEVQFSTGIANLQYPQSFEKYCQFEDVEIQNFVSEQIPEAKEIEAEEKRIAEEKDKQKIAELEKDIQNSIIKKEKRIDIVKKKRSDDIRMIFFVFQGDSFSKEYNGGYIWAPCYNNAGHKEHHWDRLLDVRAGDVILHSSGGFINAISVARGACYNCEQPKELRTEKLWERNGRKIDCDYKMFKRALDLADYKKEIIDKSAAKYSPFNRNGTGNQGYLYDLNRELSQLFISEIIKKNPEFLNYDFIKEIIEDK